jgi:hypothetical protein
MFKHFQNLKCHALSLLHSGLREGAKDEDFFRDYILIGIVFNLNTVFICNITKLLAKQKQAL